MGKVTQTPGTMCRVDVRRNCKWYMNSSKETGAPASVARKKLVAGWLAGQQKNTLLTVSFSGCKQAVDHNVLLQHRQHIVHHESSFCGRVV
jgi:hypothetical protein